MNWNIYNDMIYGPELRKLFKKGKDIKHQETCPTCNRMRVNIYKRDGIWKCKKCWDEEI